MRSLKAGVAVLAVVLGLFSALRAQTVEEAPLTIEKCIELAVSRNPLVLSSLEKYRAALARVNQAREFHQPSLELDSDLQPRALDLRGSDESYIGFTQTIEFPGKRLVRGRIASREADEAMSELDLLKQDLIYQVKESFFSVLLAEENIKCARQDLDLSEDFLKKAEVMRSAGDIAEVEVMRARVERAKAINVLKTAENEKKLAAAKLNNILARRIYEPLKVQGTLKGPDMTFDAEKLTEKALTARPEMKGLESSRRAESLRRTLASLSYLPDFDLGVSRHRITGETTTWDFTLSLQVPLFFWQPKRGAIAEAEANLRSIEKEAEHLRDSIHLDVEESTLNAVAARDQMRLYEEQILAQAEEVYNVFLFKFQKGEIGGIELLEARRSLNESRKSYADSLFNYRVAVAALEKSVGYSLERGSNESN